MMVKIVFPERESATEGAGRGKGKGQPNGVMEKRSTDSASGTSPPFRVSLAELDTTQ